LSGKSTTPSIDQAVDLEIEIEFFDVLHTKHMHQRSKVWDDGFLEYHVKSKKLVLYASSTRC
jgi:hypothetical protein